MHPINACVKGAALGLAWNAIAPRTLNVHQEDRLSEPSLESAMQSKIPSANQDHIDAGDGVERTVTQARSGVRRGMIKVLGISVVLAIVAIGAVFVISPHPRQPATLTPSPAPSVVAQTNTLQTSAWDRRHLEANGLQKCRAFRQVVKHTSALQASGGGTISQAQSIRLEAELSAAKAMAPTSLTPMQCGVPL